MDLDKLTERDRADFRNRMAKLGLDEKAIIADVLEVANGTTKRLEMADLSDQRPHILETSDLDMVRRWIGVPEVAAEALARQPHERVVLEGRAAATATKRSAAKAVSKRSDGGSLSIAPQELLEAVRRYKAAAPKGAERKAWVGHDQLQVLRTSARTYVRGNFKTVEPYKAAIETFFGSFQVAGWLFGTVIVRRNSTLVFGTGSHNLTAHEVIIEPGGRIVSYGHLAVNATILRRPLIKIHDLPDHILAGPLVRATSTRRLRPLE